MTKGALMLLAVGVMVAAVCPSLRAQAIAESAVIHANSGVSAGVAKVLGGHVQQSLSHTGSQFSYPPARTRTARRSRARRGKAGARLAGTSPIAIKSVVGGPAACSARSAAAAPQGKPGAQSASGNCVVKAPAPVAKNSPSEITVSF